MDIKKELQDLLEKASVLTPTSEVLVVVEKIKGIIAGLEPVVEAPIVEEAPAPEVVAEPAVAEEAPAEPVAEVAPEAPAEVAPEAPVSEEVAE